MTKNIYNDLLENVLLVQMQAKLNELIAENNAKDWFIKHTQTNLYFARSELEPIIYDIRAVTELFRTAMFNVLDKYKDCTSAVLYIDKCGTGNCIFYDADKQLYCFTICGDLKGE